MKIHNNVWDSYCTGQYKQTETWKLPNCSYLEPKLITDLIGILIGTSGGFLRDKVFMFYCT